MNKLKTILFLIWIFCSASLFAQNSYFVLNVKGNVKLKKTGTVLKVNDQITDKDVLQFGSASDAVVVISSKNGRMVLKPKPTAKESELMCVISEIISPGTGRLSTRAGKITNTIELKKFFSHDSLAIIGNTKVWISATAYPMNAENFFFVRYNWKGEQINKKLTFVKDSLLLSKDEIYKVDGKPINMTEVNDAKLYYKKGAQVLELCSFTILFLDETSVKSTVLAFKKNSTVKGEDFFQEVTALIKDAYGRKTDKDNLKSWLGKNVGKY